MKRITAIAHFVAVTLITTGCALAQDRLVQATVPFDFTLNGSSMPAGTYTIGYDIANAKVLSIRNRQRGVDMWAMGVSDANEPSKTGALVFHRCGDHYFLSEVRYSNSSRKIDFPESKAEKRAREHALEAGLPANNNVLVALN
jgi:hypothetical protein